MEFQSLWHINHSKLCIFSKEKNVKLILCPFLSVNFVPVSKKKQKLMWYNTHAMVSWACWIYTIFHEEYDPYQETVDDDDTQENYRSVNDKDTRRLYSKDACQGFFDCIRLPMCLIINILFSCINNFNVCVCVFAQFQTELWMSFGMKVSVWMKIESSSRTNKSIRRGYFSVLAMKCSCTSKVIIISSTKG